jgi:hypothetical protein
MAMGTKRKARRFLGTPLLSCVLNDGDGLPVTIITGDGCRIWAMGHGNINDCDE